ncbi:Uncharacterised protein [Mycobacteroides abscessus subsp. bolletii]|uniref:hypothetical protein n=1 Tax=Mycobacteroides abscessus TaxID=36809 RepID=UPI00092A45C2|nr:hypothetical protein [Mycobacteroides abscessus]MDO3332796.1 hypothetical protein [Mycobacteroides abscessus subsp. bolletii]QSM90574.1 hypothetical protein I3U44_07880 [Mycobacteroides abscessus subsp. bolletii]SHP99909.1 Uncharacterised protein [Mycobacteroides abscessus subsp. bolletii]SHR81827.1 Uncharacterised protein [Mycobacteroides abscessus subsp. bolletii]SHS56263.1 Uncharacterised protein [Mycobacteroides abscessus subsp. bolletii]
MHRLMAAAVTGGILQGHSCELLALAADSDGVVVSRLRAQPMAVASDSGSGGREEREVGTVIVEGSVTVPTAHVITAVHSVGPERMSKQTSNQPGASRPGREASALANRRATRGV